MAPRKKQIPIDDIKIKIDIKGLKTLKDKGWSNQAIADYYTENLHEKIGRKTIERRLKELEETEK
jgi:Ulp1 family protease